MGPLDLLTRPLRSLLGEAEHAEADVEHHSPLGEVRELESKVDEAMSALHRAADSMERHVAVVEALASTLAPLTTSVIRLTDQLNDLLAVVAPLASAEREVSRVEHLFGRRRRAEPPPPPPEGQPPSPLR